MKDKPTDAAVPFISPVYIYYPSNVSLRRPQRADKNIQSYRDKERKREREDQTRRERDRQGEKDESCCHVRRSAVLSDDTAYANTHTHTPISIGDTPLQTVKQITRVTHTHSETHNKMNAERPYQVSL